ncbi:MAG: DUF4270 domain-containing protein [Flavobacteriales bacterium]|nr:DUF4270 domain-containing protein [Flavobacteriales bacterium]
MTHKILSNSWVAVLVVFLLISCDKEFVDAGSTILDGDQYTLPSYSSSIETKNIFFNAVETGNLPVNSIGVYNHKNTDFGTLNHSFVSQVSLPVLNPEIGEVESIESVTLSVPFYSTLTGVDDKGNGVYELDSIYGDYEKSRLILKVHESNYLMSDFSSDLISKRKYFSNEGSTFKANLGVQDLVKDTIVLSKTSIPFTDENGTTINLSPRVFMKMDTTFFRQKIFDLTAELATQEKFKRHFRGLFFETELVEGDGMLMNLNFAKAQIIIRYKEKNPAGGTLPKIMYISLSGHTANFFDQNEAKAIADRLVLKGGNGAIAEIELFGTKDELKELQKDPFLINEANLVFKVDHQLMNQETQLPERIYVYDMQNDTTLVDYRNDFTTGKTFKFNKKVFSGLKEKDAQGQYQYKVRITEHVHKILQSSDNSLNVKLGVSLTDNILDTSKRKSNGKYEDGKDVTVNLPLAHTYSPFGVILYNEKGDNQEKNKLELEIHYSKPK